MRDLYPLVFFLVLGLFLGFLQFASSRMDDRNAATSSPPTATQLDKAQAAESFLGRILHVDGKFVLRDSASNDTYLLDDQEEAKPFDGRTVKVVGILDPASKTIHVL
jgi:hypothetical protein